jgi:predicted nucleic acid-binding protein
MKSMSGKSFVDTNILFYAHDRQAGPKHDRANRVLVELLGSDAGVLSTQVLQEFCVNLRRKGNLTADEARRVIQDFLGWEIVVNTAESVLGALEIESRHDISFWDALIVYAAQAAGAEILYSEDLNDGQMFGPIRVVNPLRG